MSLKVKNFLNNLQDPADRQRVAANLGIDLKAVMSEQPHNSTATPPAIGNNNIYSEEKTMTETIYGHRADGTAISREYAEKNINTWYSEAETFSELGDMVYQLQQSMTMSNCPEDMRITSESDFQAEVKRGKELLGLN
jgi:hypothetical protein